MRRNKLIFAGEKNAASQSPTGVLSGANVAHTLVWSMFGAGLVALKLPPPLTCDRHDPLERCTADGQVNAQADAIEASATAISNLIFGNGRSFLVAPTEAAVPCVLGIAVLNCTFARGRSQCQHASIIYLIWAMTAPYFILT